MALHSNLEGFMNELKALPKGSAQRGKFITANMSHPPFLAALQNHPEGKKMHAQLMGFLNSSANAGPQNKPQVMMRNEDLAKGTDDVKGGGWGHVSNQPQGETTTEGLEAPYKGEWNNFLGSGNLYSKHFVHNDRHLNQIQAAKQPDGKISVQYIPHTDDSYAADEQEFAENFPGKTYIPYEPATKLGSVNSFPEAQAVGDAMIAHLKSGGAKEDFTHPALQANSMPGRHGSSVEAPGRTVAPQMPQKLMNSEKQAIILKTEGEISVADEKDLSVEEAAEIIRKDWHEKLAKYSKELENLVKRENTAKALVPSHKHNQGSAASAGTEDIPAGVANPKGTAKAEGDDKKECPHCKAKVPAKKDGGLYPHSVPGSNGKVSCTPKGAQNNYAGTDHAKAEACAKCGEMHKDKVEKCGEITKGEDKSHKFVSHGKFGTEEGRVCASCGEGIMHSNHDPKPSSAKPVETKKSDLIDSKGKISDNHTDPKADEMPNESPKEPEKRADSSGGKMTKSGGPKGMAKRAQSMTKAEVKKTAAPPMAKPPSGTNMATKVPTSAPKAPPAMKTAEVLDKGIMAEHGQREAAAMGFNAKPPPAAKPVKLPGSKDQAARASSFESQMAEVNKPPAAGPAGAKLGLASPKKAGVTQSAGPVQSAAKPKPGIFGKLFGKKQ